MKTLLERIVLFLFALILELSFLSWVGYRLTCWSNYETQVTSRLKRVATTTSVDLATQELDGVLAYLNTRQCTAGSTGIFRASQECDVGFWYRNLLGARASLRNVKEDNFGEQIQLLLKLNQVLIENTPSGSSVIEPEGISVFPDNLTVCLWGSLTFVFFVTGVATHFCWFADTVTT